jgi:16S rRNA (cytidine1402-2'-O)-methyltransferase
LSELLASVRSDPPRGEITLVVGGAGGEDRVEPTAQELARRARALMDAGTERREALAQVAKDAGVPRRKVFDALLEES